jgi:hypothetical protein
MISSSSLLHHEDLDAIANRLMQKAHTRDGLPEIAVGIIFLTIAGLMGLLVVFQPGSFGYKASALGMMLLFPTMALGSQWAIKQVRRRFLIGKVGYVETKPVNRKRFGFVFSLAFAIAVAAVFAAYRGLFPPAGWILAGTGIFGGALAAFAGRLPRYVIGGAIMAATGILLAIARVSLEMGFTVLYGLMGLLSLISGCVVLLFFLRKPAEAGK